MIWIVLYLLALGLLISGGYLRSKISKAYNAGENFFFAALLVGFGGALAIFLGPTIIVPVEADHLYAERTLSIHEVSEVTLIDDEVHYVQDGQRHSVNYGNVALIEGDKSSLRVVEPYLKDGLLWVTADAKSNRFEFTLPEGELKF